MKAGNLPDKFDIELDFIKEGSFIASSQNRVLLNPHQGSKLNNTKYSPLNLHGKIIQFNCTCINTQGENIFDKYIKKYELENKILWLDTRNVPIECISSIIYNWQHMKNDYSNIALGIPIIKEYISMPNKNLSIWLTGIKGAIKKRKPKYSIWYPSLELSKESLLQASEHLNPYDVYPILDYSKLMEPGEKTLTKHAKMLELTRTRTRHFMIFNPSHPKIEFNNFYNTLRTMPRSGPLLFHPVITPGGNCINFFVSLIAGSLTNSYFMTPYNTIPIDSYEQLQGILVLRKVA